MGRSSRRKKLVISDQQALNESVHIRRAFFSKTMDFGICLRKNYVVDGQRFGTGFKHRKIG